MSYRSRATGKAVTDRWVRRRRWRKYWSLVGAARLPGFRVYSKRLHAAAQRYGRRHGLPGCD